MHLSNGAAATISTNLFPGGAVEGNESPTEALVREIREELGIRIEVGQLVAEVSYQGSVQYYFAARVIGGIFGTGCGREIVGPTAPDDGTHTPVWIPIAQLHEKPVHPKRAVEIILRANGKRAGPLHPSSSRIRVERDGPKWGREDSIEVGVWGASSTGYSSIST